MRFMFRMPNWYDSLCTIWITELIFVGLQVQVLIIDEFTHLHTTLNAQLGSYWTQPRSHLRHVFSFLYNINYSKKLWRPCLWWSRSSLGWSIWYKDFYSLFRSLFNFMAPDILCVQLSNTIVVDFSSKMHIPSFNRPLCRIAWFFLECFLPHG